MNINIHFRVHNILHNMHYTLYSIDYTLHTSTVHTLDILYSVQYVQCVYGL